MHLIKKTTILVVLVMSILAVHLPSHAQELPPRPMKVTTFQNLSFGAFINGFSGGTVTVRPEGNREQTGGIYLVNMNVPVNPAIFEVEALPGNIIHVVLPVYATLSGPQDDIIMEINSSLPISPFVNSEVPPFKTQVRIGGTLFIESTTPAGNYFGTFSVTFIQE